jgi:hypothetical protein
MDVELFHRDGLTDIQTKTKLIVTFFNFAKATNVTIFITLFFLV